jgi:hypothetical protein
MSVGGIEEVRARAKAALAPASDDDPQVLDLSDAVEPPVLMLDWDDPWLVFRTACTYDAQLAVLCIAGRLEPLPGVEDIERLAVYTLGRMAAAPDPWLLSGSQSNRILRVGNMPYFGARLVYRIRVTIQTAPAHFAHLQFAQKGA